MRTNGQTDMTKLTVSSRYFPTRLKCKNGTYMAFKRLFFILRTCRYSSFMGIHFTGFLFNVRRYCYLVFAFRDQPSVKPVRRAQGSVQWYSRCGDLLCVFSTNGLRQQSERWAYFVQQFKFPPSRRDTRSDHLCGAPST